MIDVSDYIIESIKNIWGNQIGGNVKLIGFVEYIKNIWGCYFYSGWHDPKDPCPPGG